MAKSITLVLGGTKLNGTEAKARIKLMLNSYLFDSPVSDQDATILIDLIRYHPEADEKIGCGIKGFKVVREKTYGHKRFEIIRTDGTTSDFSYVKCCSGSPETHRQLVIKAMRCEVRDQITDFFRETFSACDSLICPLNGSVVTQKNYHVDHAPPNTFQRMATDFLAGENVDAMVITDGDSHGNFADRFFKDRTIAISWQNYHRSHARLRIVSSIGNLQLPKV